MKSDIVTLRVGGKKYGGWENVSVTRGIEAIAGGFTLSVSERWANQNVDWPITEGDACTVAIGDDIVCSGFVDSRGPEYSANDHRIEISGRDKSCDLVDCSALLDHWEYKQADVVKLARKLCDPFGIRVAVQPGLILPGGTISTPAGSKLAITVGETAFNVLAEACRLAAIMPIYNSADDELLLTRAGSDRATTELVRGQNVKTASAKFDMSNRFRKYVLLGQHAATDDFFGPQAAQIKATAEDPNVPRAARTLVIRPEGNVTLDYAKARVQWEASVRAAKADTVSMTVQGWRQKSGDLWPINALVHVRDSLLRIDGDMLIAQTQFTADRKSGKQTVLALKRPDAFKPEPSVKPDGLWKEISRGV